MHEIGHHHAVCFHTHAAAADIGAQEPRAVGGRHLACLDELIGHVLQQQGVLVAQEAGHGGVGGDLVEEEQAPVVAVGHRQLAVGQCQPVQHVVLHMLLVVHQRIGLPLRVAALEQQHRQMGLAQLLLHHVLIAGVEQVVVLQRVVVVEVLAAVVAGHRLLVVVGVDDCLVIGVIHL